MFCAKTNIWVDTQKKERRNFIKIYNQSINAIEIFINIWYDKNKKKKHNIKQEEAWKKKLLYMQ